MVSNQPSKLATCADNHASLLPRVGTLVRTLATPIGPSKFGGNAARSSCTPELTITK